MTLPWGIHHIQGAGKEASPTGWVWEREAQTSQMTSGLEGGEVQFCAE